MPIISFGVGFFAFPHDLRSNRGIGKINDVNPNIMEEIRKSSDFQRLSNDPDVVQYSLSEKVPSQHRKNYVGSGLLFGPDLMEIDPVLLLNGNTGEMAGFYHLGDKLVSYDGLVHNGIIATILDEGLCTCGFSKLPSKRGVTAKLSINFHEQAPPNSTVVLMAKVLEARGRKVIINGTLKTFPLTRNEKSITIADAQCILVEPKWFKYFKWVQLW